MQRRNRRTDFVFPNHLDLEGFTIAFVDLTCHVYCSFSVCGAVNVHQDGPLLSFIISPSHPSNSSIIRSAFASSSASLSDLLPHVTHVSTTPRCQETKSLMKTRRKDDKTNFDHKLNRPVVYLRLRSSELAVIMLQSWRIRTEQGRCVTSVTSSHDFLLSRSA